MKSYNLALRIWHWLNAIAVSGLLATFFLRKTFLSWHDNAALITAKLAEFDIAITAEQAKMIAKAIRAPMWEWHIIFGFMLALLLLWRAGTVLMRGFGYEKSPNAHMRWVYRGYKALYAILAFLAISGIVIYLRDTFGVSKELAHDFKELHEVIAWSVVLFVPLHIAGVVMADNSDQKGLVSKMISG